MTSARPCPSNTGSGNNFNLLNSLRFLQGFFFFSMFALSFLSLGYLKMWPLLVSVHQPRSCGDIAAAGHPHKPTLLIIKKNKQTIVMNIFTVAFGNCINMLWSSIQLSHPHKPTLVITQLQQKTKNNQQANNLNEHISSCIWKFQIHALSLYHAIPF